MSNRQQVRDTSERATATHREIYVMTSGENYTGQNITIAI